MIDIRVMTCGDLPFGRMLSKQAGWNQTAADWLRLLELQAGGCFVAHCGGQCVGTVTTCVFDDVGWIGMMLVDPVARRQGVGRALMNRAIQYLEDQAVNMICLDATPMGEPLYTSLEFKPQYQLTRFTGIPLNDEHVERSHEPDWEQIATFDMPLTGYSRQKLFRRFGEEPDIHAIVNQNGSQMLGYVCTRPGRLAAFVGPCMAIDSKVGDQLLRQAMSLFRGQAVFVDVPNNNRPAMETVESLGLEPTRYLTRMCLGVGSLEPIESLWASSGPAKG